MTYLALARKWRPRSLDALVGQEHVVTALGNAFAQGRLHHAWLLTGTRGVGKTTLARIMAKMLNCEQGVGAHPCGTCRACAEIDAGRFVDLIEMDAASNTGVNDMREVLDNAQYLPVAGRFKIYLIDEVHMLSRSAFNSMLKTLEEPPEHVKFVLATTDPQKIPVTVLSRCLQFSLRPLTAIEIAAHLERVLDAEGLGSESAAVRLLARSARGSMRDALSLLDQAIAYGGGQVAEATVRDMLGAVDAGWLHDVLEALADGDGAAVLAGAQRLGARSLSADAALQELASILHLVAVAQAVPGALPEGLPEQARIEALALRLSPEDAQLYYQIALGGRRDLPLAPDEETGLAMTLLRMLAFRADNGAASAPAARAASLVAAPNPRTAAPDLAPRPAPVTAAAPDRAPSEPFDGDWLALVPRLKLAGMARMLAQHCSLTSCDAGVIHLSLAPANRHLLDRNYQDRLREAVHAAVKGTPEIRITVAEAHAPSVAGLRRQEEIERREQAQQAIAEDPVLQQLQAECGARIDPATIQPHGKE